MPLLFGQVKIAYEGRRLQPRPFNRFIQHLIDVNGGEEFWTLQLNNLNAAIFPSLARTEYSPEPDRSFSHMMTNLPDHKKNYTLSSVIQLAWALVLARYTDSEDVVFGLTVNGRTASLFGITEVTGPTIATIPYRVKLSQEKTVHDSLSDLQRQSTRMIPFLQHGLQHIRKLGPDAAKACEFQSHLGIQPAGILAEETLGWLEKVDQEGFQQEYERFVSHALTMICHMQDDSSDLRITVNYDPSVLQDTEARRLVHQFQAVVHQLSANPHCAIRDVQVISAEDLTQLAAWNGQVPSATHETLHDLVLRQVAGQPDAEAVCAWDGELTYQQLGDYSALLAQHFLTLGISPESRIAICLEKSRWTIVILLGALRAGAACVLLDPAYPRQRIEQLVKKTVPQLLLASQTHGNLAQCLGTRGIVSGEAFIRSLAPLSIDLPDISPSQAAFILFTSGSTGKSKAIIMEHVNLSSSICAHSSALNLSSTSRSLHFASYAFDASIYEIFDTLICGGCVCIPSEVSHFGKENSASGLDCTIRFPYITVHDTLASYSPVEARVIKFPAPVVSQ
jgi:non-ribosomal peptide synthetase component F